ncbi:Ureidoglycolate hydrolase [Haematobacter massiliensis]|uniref:Ureidoglycolate hydrolase n=1 Tax=Haematobacter massiliensis TaxID=195105 RepID=A0A086XYP8_9RHOB|nr:ureidoglycolate lyase [Haematobacter massiliensis]KFI27148.1 Ureidoglycolate hydrolase [Haematobacter massiliensis]OWJ73242.1 Ureidoglycolate hydrolase [Haematobacter massiliensis]OWJ85380.1 Ureidoglycolate hydrolase [Haematobacter massiliensis]QBJ23661.1 ureidoglycolate lyase [Haematobacter massiliensis]
MRQITIQPLTLEAFAPFGDILAADGTADRIINQGLCGRWHDRAGLDFGPEGRAGLSIFKAEPRALPLKLDLVERHPDGSQAFVPMSLDPFLVIVAPDDGGRPGMPLAFLTTAGQAINFHRGTWHGVLTPLHAPGLFAVVDRIGDTPNLEEYWFDDPYTVVSP